MNDLITFRYRFSSPKLKLVVIVGVGTQLPARGVAHCPSRECYAYQSPLTPKEIVLYGFLSDRAR